MPTSTPRNTERLGRLGAAAAMANAVAVAVAVVVVILKEAEMKRSEAERNGGSFILFEHFLINSLISFNLIFY